MTEDRSSRDWAEIDKRVLWHPFTPMTDWCAADYEPVVIERAEGVWLWDANGKRYLDANASIWTNVHGHNHPMINAAMKDQLDRVAHVSFLGTTNAPAIALAEALVSLFPADSLSRVFYSDDGSTAIECALKMAVQFWQLSGSPERCEFAAFTGAYHGDTLGASALGGIPTFHDRFRHFGYKVHRIGGMDDLDSLPADRLAALCIEPLIRGADGMRLWPEGMLKELRGWADQRGVLLVFDEVLTGFGRTGRMFACDHEEVTPDFLALAKGLTGGYLPLGATLTTERIFEAFLGDPARTFFYGHSYCGNPLACAAALASLEVFEEEKTLEALPAKIELIGRHLGELEQNSPRAANHRQCGMIAAFDLMNGDGNPHPPVERAGARFCHALRERGVLTRPIGDTIVFMPPLCVQPDQIADGMNAISDQLVEGGN